MSVKVKICGIKTIEAATTAIKSGVDFLGFNFVPTSKRYIDPKKAQEIIEGVKGAADLVGVFQNEDVIRVNEVAANLGLDFVQLHGMEDNKYISRIDFPVIKSIAIYDDPVNIQAQYFLLDRVNREGEMVDLDMASKLAEQFPIFLAGGFDPDNVAEAVNKVKPFAVDVAGGVETRGEQDLEKIKLFIENAKGVNI